MKKLLQRFLVFVLLVGKVEVVEAQWVAIPDFFFASYLQTNFPSCMNGNLMDTTCLDIINATSVTCNGILYIADLTGIQYFDNLQYLKCDNNVLTSLPTLPTSLLRLDCYSNDLTALPQLPPNLKYLNCIGNNIANFQSFPSSLDTLYCSSNDNSTLPTLPPNLILLNCGGSPNFTLIPSLPPTLKSFHCEYSINLVNIPLLPNNLVEFNCSYCSTINLPSTLPDSLRIFSCWKSGQTSLPLLPDSLKDLNCRENQITIMPALPQTLRTLNCSSNLLAVLPVLPNTLISLNCVDNQLNSLPALPNSLLFISCGFNQLGTLPALPQSLNQLICCYNPLTVIPTLPGSILSLDCRGTLITSIPEIPDTLVLLAVDDNPNLTCLPEFKFIDGLYFSNTGIQCVSNYGSVYNSTPQLSSMSLCQLFNTNNCELFWNISGCVYADANNNCLNDNSEGKFSNVKLILDSAGVLFQQTYTISDGRYSFDTDTGTYTYTIDTTNLPVMVTCPIAGFQTSVLTALDSMDYNMDFGMQCKPGFDVGVKSVVRSSGMFFPGNASTMQIAAGDMTNFYGLNCAAGISGTVTVVISGPANYTGAMPGALVPVVNGDTLTYTITDFGFLNANTAFGISVLTDFTATIGDVVCFTVSVTPVSGDMFTGNNFLQNCFAVVNSFDPNDKEVFPVGNFDSTQTWLTYTINFQNTGTAPAQHIYILDTLSANLDETSFELLDYSVQPITQVIGKVVRFNFPNINLPDSVSNEPDSHGYVQFRVKIKQELAQGGVIENTAHIVFDFNAPVVTNTVTNSLQDCNQLALVTVAFNNTLLCKGDTLIANATVAFPMLASWFVDGVFAGNNLGLVHDSLSSGNHIIALTTTNNVCSQTITQNIYVDEPVKPTYTQNGNVLTSSSASNNQWYANGNSIAGANQNILTVTQSGYYMVAVTDSFGCTAFSDSMWISPVGLNELILQSFSITPNPVTSNTLIINFNLLQNTTAQFKMVDVTGQVVFKMLLYQNAKPQTIGLPDLSSGIYNCVITENGVSVNKKVTVIRE